MLFSDCRNIWYEQFCESRLMNEVECMINYNAKIKAMLKRVLSEEGFTYWRQNAFIGNVLW